MPVGIYTSDTDRAADQQDAEWVADLLHENLVFFQVYEGYTHFTFNIGKEMGYLDDLIQVLGQLQIN